MASIVNLKLEEYMKNKEVVQSRGKIITLGTLLSVALLFLDQYTKQLAVQFLKGKSPIVIFENVFLTFLPNCTGFTIEVDSIGIQSLLCKFYGITTARET